MATGNNKTIDSAEHVTYRAWLLVEAAGSFEYCFYFSNTVDSTWEDGSTSYAGKSGGKYTIESASIADGGTEFDPNVEPDSMEAVTFSGNSQKEVAPDETFWSDPVTLDVPENHYLLWEWTVTGTEIPCICMSNMTYAYADQGNGKGFNSLWNLGLGYARATDCAVGGDWLNRAVAGADLITVAFGTNDIISGPYGGSGHATAAEIEDAVRTITKKCTDSGVQTIVWNSPPFDLSAELEPIRTEYNATAASIAADCGAQFFDAASLLADPTDASKTVYGQHPNDEGGTVLATALAEKIREMENK